MSDRYSEDWSMVKSPYAGLRLTVFQLRSLDPLAGNDGSQVILLDMLRHFSVLGVRITVYCMWRPDHRHGDFEPFPGVLVRPMLRLNHEAADPYSSPPYILGDAINVLRQAAEENDILYIHDGNLRFRLIAEQLPTVIGVHDVVYGHTLAGALDFSRDRLLTGSDYTASCLREVFRRFRPLSDDALHAVNYGFDTSRFTKRDPRPMRDALRLSPDAIAVLFPHRPEPGKGMSHALSAVSLLRHRLPAHVFARVRVLLPVWHGSEQTDDLADLPAEIYPEARARARELGIAETLHLHRWVPHSRMPEYYSAGTATLCVGTYPEAFGNVHIESMLCGTPTVISRVAAQRTTVPEELSRKVDPGDAEGIAEQLAEVIGRGERTPAATHRYLVEKYNARRMLRGFEEAVLRCQQRPPLSLAPVPGPLAPEAQLRIPPWAARLASGFYHDYTGYHRNAELARCVEAIERGTTVHELCASGMAARANLDRWLNEGLLASDPAAMPYAEARERGHNG